MLCGDSELAEGSIWEALDKAAYYELDNFTAIVDVNRLGQRGPTELGWDLDAYARRVAAFGCHPIEVDGHDLGGDRRGLRRGPATPGGPSVILARTIKGKGLPEIEDKDGWHGVALPAELAERAIAELGGRSARVVTSRASRSPGPRRSSRTRTHRSRSPRYALGDKVPTRKA